MMANHTSISSVSEALFLFLAAGGGVNEVILSPGFSTDASPGCAAVVREDQSAV